MTKLFLDEDMHSGLVPAFRLRGVDAVHVRDLGREGMSDQEQLLEAARQGRALVTFNQKDYTSLHIEFLNQNIPHSGIIMGPQVSIKEALKRILGVINNHPNLQNNLWYF